MYSYVNEWKSLWEPDLEAIGYNGATCDPTLVDPKVLQWAKENCAHMPHFVKVIKRNAANGRPGLAPKNMGCLSVPAPFVQEHYRELERVITLENEEGRTWRVSFDAPRKYPRWSQGWDRVARDNNLTPGDVVVFVLVRSSCFHFTLFDGDGNIKKENRTSRVNAAAGMCNKEVPSCSSRSCQDQPFVSNFEVTEAEDYPKTRKLLFTVCTNSPSKDEIVQFDGTVLYSRHRNGKEEADDQVSVPSKEQAATARSSHKRKLEKVGEQLAAAGQTLNLATEPDFQLVAKTVTVSGNSPSNTITTMPSAKEAKRGANSGTPQSSPVQTVEGGIPPWLESFNPSAFDFKSRRRMPTALERQGAEDSAMAHAKLLTGYYFTCVMLETHVYHDFHLVLPDCFVTALRLPATHTRLKFLDRDGNTWEIYSKKNACNQFALHRKFWAMFALHHFLEEGDVCVFALQENESLVRTILVDIFRVVAISRNEKTSVRDHYEMHEIHET